MYDAAGQRVRKVIERQNGARKNERIYLGGFEIYPRVRRQRDQLALERETLHVMDDKQRIALVETRTQGDDRLTGATHPLPVRQPPRLGQLELDDRRRSSPTRSIPLRQHVVSGGAQPD